MKQDSDKKVRSRAFVNCAGALVSVLAAVSFLFALGVALQRREAKIERLAELDRVTLRNLVTEVNAICDELGRAPQDEEELETLLGKPLPDTHWRTSPIKVCYHRRGDNAYELRILNTSGMRTYSSDKPENGWVDYGELEQ